MCFPQGSQEDRLCSQLRRLCLRLYCDNFIPFSLSPGDTIPAFPSRRLIIAWSRGTQRKNLNDRALYKQNKMCLCFSDVIGKSGGKGLSLELVSGCK